LKIREGNLECVNGKYGNSVDTHWSSAVMRLYGVYSKKWDGVHEHSVCYRTILSGLLIVCY